MGEGLLQLIGRDFWHSITFGSISGGLGMSFAQTGSWPTPVRGRNVQFDHLGISRGRIRANNRGVVFHP